jgi:hypothetical protein
MDKKINWGELPLAACGEFLSLDQGIGLNTSMKQEITNSINNKNKVRRI